MFAQANTRSLYLASRPFIGYIWLFLNFSIGSLGIMFHVAKSSYIVTPGVEVPPRDFPQRAYEGTRTICQYLAIANVKDTGEKAYKQ